MEVFHKAKKLIGQLLRGRPDQLVLWLQDPTSGRIGLCVAIVAVGCGIYGVALGCWRSTVMGVYVGVKFPLLIALTLLCNALINGVLGLLLGSRLGFMQSILALLMSFSVFALIVGALTPVLLYLMLQLPAAGSGDARLGHAAYLLIHTAIIASAGVVAKVHLYRCLKAYCPSIRAARCTLAAWLGGNAFVGAQFSWILRPFFGSPGLEVAFLREDPMNGTFYEAVWKSCRTVAPESVNRGDLVFCILFISVVVGLLRALRTFYLELTNHEDRRSNHE